jgi:hypothetical protein
MWFKVTIINLNKIEDVLIYRNGYITPCILNVLLFLGLKVKVILMNAEIIYQYREYHINIKQCLSVYYM